MRALVKTQAAPGLVMQDMPMPEPQANQVLIKIEKTAICGTDMHIYHWDAWSQKNVPLPLIIGHEFYGKIVALGSAVHGLKIGQRVSGEGHLVCGECRFCRTGMAHLCPKTRGVGYHVTGVFAEYFCLDSKNVVVLPDDISDDMAAILDPFGNATHTALAFDLLGEDVLITGAGPIGIIAVAIAKYAGARRVVISDVNDFRLSLAKKMGADSIINVQKTSLTQAMQALDIHYGFSVGMEMSGNPVAFSDMISVLQHGAGLALLGIPPGDLALDWHQVIFKCLRIHGIYGRKMYSTWYKMLSMLEGGLDLSPVITHYFNVNEYEKAFASMASGQTGKVILEWT